MRKSLKILFVGATAAVVLAAAVGVASANRLRTSSQQFKSTWTALPFIAPEVFGASTTIRCPVTLEGSFHSQTIVKTTGSLIGYVNRASVNSGGCTNGHATILTATLPWHVTYEGFTGALPNITALRLLLLGASFLVQTEFSCLARSEVNHPINGLARLNTSHVVTSLEAEANNLPLTGGFPCELGTGSLQASASTVTNGSGASITVTLI
jgi:hypothetical protein